MNFYYWLGYISVGYSPSYFFGFELLIESASFKPARDSGHESPKFFDPPLAAMPATGPFSFWRKNR